MARAVRPRGVVGVKDVRAPTVAEAAPRPTPRRKVQSTELFGDAREVIITGFNVRPLPRATLRFGVELPLTDARTFDYTILGGLVREF
jgi:hypothetical protein